MQSGNVCNTTNQVNPPCSVCDHTTHASQSLGPPGYTPVGAITSPVASQPTESWQSHVAPTPPTENRGSAPHRFSFGDTIFGSVADITSPSVPHRAPALLPLTPSITHAGGGKPFTPGSTPGEFTVPGLTAQYDIEDLPPNMGAVEQGVRSFDDLLVEAAASQTTPDGAQQDGTPERDIQSAPAAPTPVATRRRQKRAQGCAPMETESGGGVSSSDEDSEEDMSRKEFLCAVTRSVSREESSSPLSAQGGYAGGGAAPDAAPIHAWTLLAADDGRAAPQTAGAAGAHVPPAQGTDSRQGAAGRENPAAS